MVHHWHNDGKTHTPYIHMGPYGKKRTSMVCQKVQQNCANQDAPNFACLNMNTSFCVIRKRMQASMQASPSIPQSQMWAQNRSTKLSKALPKISPSHDPCPHPLHCLPHRTLQGVCYPQQLSSGHLHGMLVVCAPPRSMDRHT